MGSNGMILPLIALSAVAVIGSAQMSIDPLPESVDDVPCFPADSNVSVRLNESSEFGFCEQYRTGMAPVCDDVFSDGMYIFIPTIRQSLENIVYNVQTQFMIFNLISEEGPTSSSTEIDCFEAGRIMFCYWYFIPCGGVGPSGTGLPRPLCMDECLTISADKCVSEWETAVSLLESNPGRVASGFGLPDCCDLAMLTGPAHNCCQPLGVFDRQALNPPYEVCFPELGTAAENDTALHDDNMTTLSTTTFIIAGCAAGAILLLLLLAGLTLLTIALLFRRRNRARSKKVKDGHNTAPSSNMGTLLTNTNYGFSLDVNQSYTQQGLGESKGGGKVRSVYRREIESHNLVIPIHWLTLQEVLGEGEFGTVRRGLLAKGGSGREITVAIKKLKGLSPVTQEEVDKFIEESLKMKEFHHRHVMGLHGICLHEPSSPMIIMPFMSNGDLLSYLKSRRQQWEQLDRNTDVVTECGLLSMCHQIAQGMEYLARLKFVHRDLAARNCMIDANFMIKVSDFGLSRDVYSRNYYQGGRGEKVPARWMPVEALVDGLWSEKSDVWAYGVTCWEIFTFGYTPYPGVDVFSIVQYLQDGHRLTKPTICSQEVYSVLQQCWEARPEERPSFSRLRESVESILENVAGYTELNAHSTLEAGLQPAQQELATLSNHLQLPSAEITPLETENDLTESGYINV